MSFHSHLYQMGVRVPVSSHLTNYRVDLRWPVQPIHSFWAVWCKHHHVHCSMTSIRSESACRVCDFPVKKDQRESKFIDRPMQYWLPSDAVLTPIGLDECSSTIVVEFDGAKNWISFDLVALAEFKCSAVRDTVVCKSSNKLSEMSKWLAWN